MATNKTDLSYRVGPPLDRKSFVSFQHLRVHARDSFDSQREHSRKWPKYSPERPQFLSDFRLHVGRGLIEPNVRAVRRASRHRKSDAAPHKQERAQKNPDTQERLHR